MDAHRQRGDEQTALYSFYSEAGELIYVGVTFNLKKRLYQHQRDKPWWPEVARQEVAWHENRELALAEEARLLEQHTPRYNAHGTGPFPFPRDLVARMDVAARRAGMSRSRWLLKIVEEAVEESENSLT